MPVGHAPCSWSSFQLRQEPLPFHLKRRPCSVRRRRIQLRFRRIQIMADRRMRIPGPDHPISIDANPSRVVVTIGGKVIADTRDALTLREASYPAVQYVPRRDVDMAALTRSEHTTYCPYKGDAS